MRIAKSAVSAIFTRAAEFLEPTPGSIVAKEYYACHALDRAVEEYEGLDARHRRALRTRLQDEFESLFWPKNVAKDGVWFGHASFPRNQKRRVLALLTMAQAHNITNYKVPT